MKKEININFKIIISENFAFTIMVVGIVLLFLTTVVFSQKKEECYYDPELQEYLDNQKAIPSNGLE